MTRARHPVFRDLNGTDVQELLARNHVGRIAYSFHDRVDIEPIHYVFAGGAFVVQRSNDATRLIVRTRGAGEPNVPLAPLGLLVFEPAHFIMERRMLLGIKERAERSSPDPASHIRPNRRW